MHPVSFIIYCTANRVCAGGNDQSYMAAHQAQAGGGRTSVSNRLRDRRVPCTIMGPKPSGPASLNLQMAVSSSMGVGGILDS